MNKKVKTHSGNAYSKIVGFFLFLTIIAIFVVLHFALAKVTIRIFSNLENRSSTVLVEMQSENVDELSPDAIIGKIISTEFELETSAPSSQETISSEKAGGYVTIYNNYSKDQILIATTRLLTPDEKLFRIKERITIPVGGQVEVWAEADESGEEMVTGATNFIIPGLWEGLQDKIYAETTEGMTLQAIPQHQVSQENLEQAQEKIKEEAIKQSLEKINEPLAEELKIDAERLDLNMVTLESSQVGDTSREAYLKQKITAHGLIFTEEDLVKIAKEKFVKEMDSSQSLVEFLNDQFSYRVLEINLDKEEAVLEVDLSATINTGQSALQIDKDRLIGLDEAGLKNNFSEMGVDGIEIEFWPFWVKKVPRFKDHIIIE